MSNPKRDIYEAIKAQILAEVSEIKHVLLFNNQFENDKQEETPGRCFRKSHTGNEHKKITK